jgi:hypothetical protein
MASLTRNELLELAATIYDRMVAGDSEADIMSAYGLDEVTFTKARRIMLDVRAQEARTKPREHVYVEYCMAQQRNILDLDVFIKELDAKNQYNAVVGAIRLRSDLIDRIVQRGMEFGIIRKEPERKELVAGLFISDMNSGELKKAILDQIQQMNDMISRFGDGDILSLDPGGLHYGDPITTTAEVVHELPPKAAGKAKAKSSRRSAGRRRIRGVPTEEVT